MTPGKPSADIGVSRILERMQDGYFRVSPDGQILTINPAAVGILGYENADEMVGRVSVVELYADSADRDGVLAELREHGEITGYEVDLKREDGTVVRVELTVAGVLDADGNLIAQDGTLRDVTERHRQAQELERSQQQVQSLVQNVPGAIYRYQEQDGAWVCTFMSDAIEEITGFPVEYFIGQSTDQFRDLVHPDDLTLFDGGVGNATDQDDGLRFEYRITARDGGIRWIGARGSDPVVEPDGQSYIDGSIYDATRAHEAELAGQRSDATFRHLFDSMADGYWVSTPAGAIQLCNPASVQILGYPDEQALKAINVTDLWAHPEQRNDFIAQLLEARSLDDYELDVRKYDGTPITLRCTFRLVGEGEAAKIEVTFRDITRQKQVDADIREARNAAEQANQAKSTFLANMSHELRTPLNAILGYSEMLIEEAEELEEDLFSDDLQKIHSAGTHLLALINDVLDLSKIEAGHTELFAENFTLEELIRDVSSTTAPLIEKNGNTLVVEVEDPQAAARQDLTKVRQALLNLLSNAGKFTDNGTVTLAARTETEESVSWMVLSVADTGIGVAEEKHQRLFEEFSQADASTTREYGGTGLGLAISRRFCRLMGGDITVASAVGEGSTFTIRIPLQLSDNSIAQSLTLQAPESAQRSPDSALPVNPGRTVLVIDDDPEACEIIAHHLKRDGFEVVVAHSGAEGLERAREIRPAAITLDVVMPEMDGWSVLSALKADDALHDIPVVMVSMVDDKTTGYTLGATSYLTKPVGREQLLESISRQLEATGEVLIVEDDANTRGMLARVLAKAGWTVAEAEDGQQGLAELEANTPQLILLDLMMPVMDGFEFLREVRARPEWRDVPVIVITAKDLTKADRRLLSDRVEQVLTKGVYSRDQLIEVVRTALGQVATIS